jgi:hypothetical protein
MDDQTRERWFQLCQLAAVEEDPAKLLALVTEINRLLDARDAERNKSLGRQNQAWYRTPVSDKHQGEARQPYRSREQSSTSTGNDSEQSDPTKTDSQESE